MFSVPALLYHRSLDTYTHTTYDLTIPQFSWPMTRETNSDNENFSILNVGSSSLGKKLLGVLAKKYQPLRGTRNNAMKGVSSDSTCGRGPINRGLSMLTLDPHTDTTDPPPPSLYASWSVMRNLGTKHLGAINQCSKKSARCRPIDQTWPSRARLAGQSHRNFLKIALNTF